MLLVFDQKPPTYSMGKTKHLVASFYYDVVFDHCRVIVYLSFLKMTQTGNCIAVLVTNTAYKNWRIHSYWSDQETYVYSDPSSPQHRRV